MAEKIALHLLAYASYCALIVMLGLLFAGLGTMIYGLYILGYGAVYTTEKIPIKGAIHITIMGVELVFLAPLAFFVLMSLARWLADSRGANGISESSSRLMSAKAAVIGLFIAIVSADLVSRILTGTGLSYEPAISESLVIVVLSAYYIALERLSHRQTGAGTHASPDV